MSRPRQTIEHQRLEESRMRTKHWKRWGPYLAERQWGTVREDYSDGGDAWHYFSHDQARSRAFRWGEDGLLGWSDRKGRINFCPALWNGKDPILKERLFGLSGPQGNHAEDVKECYYYLASTPTHSYTKALYKYPMRRFPYSKLVEENALRGPDEDEFSIEDTDAFDDGNYWDVLTETAKGGPQDICWRITVTNNSDKEQEIYVLPQIWMRNHWSWGDDHFEADWEKPTMELKDDKIFMSHHDAGDFHFYTNAEREGFQEWLFTDNETNKKRLFSQENEHPFTKDGINDYLVRGDKDAVNPEQKGTKAAALYKLTVPAGESRQIQCRLIATEDDTNQRFEGFDWIFNERIRDEEDYYHSILPFDIGEQERKVAVQGYAGLLWSKQFYYYVVQDWRIGDNGKENASQARMNGRNSDWEHLFARDILSMPDKWEYPWFASWDSAFHMVAFARLDPDFTKKQLLLFLREWYLHPNGQIPAYEWSFSDVNPPVHAWAVWQVYLTLKNQGDQDLDFLERTVQKLFLNYTWWINQKDVNGNHLFSGGFLGLDNIGVFDRSQDLGDGAYLLQSDGTAWMGLFSAMMLEITLELAINGRTGYEDMASKFFESFVRIARAMNEEEGDGLWHEEDCFYYDQLVLKNGEKIPLKVRSMVGLLTLIGVTVLDLDEIDHLSGFKKRLNWFLENRPELSDYTSYRDADRQHESERLLAMPLRERFESLMDYLSDPKEFLSDFGLRSLSKHHGKHPFSILWKGQMHSVSYVPGESDGYMFGGNSNWRGPVWFPVNYMIISALRRYQHYYGDELKIDFPKGSGTMRTIGEIADCISDRLIALFIPDQDGARPCFGDQEIYHEDQPWGELIHFHEFFHGDNGRGLGASHQTGWSALVVTLIQERAQRQRNDDI